MSRLDRDSRVLAHTLFLLSGATSLVYQVVWLRLLILIFGSTLFATSAILTTFMGGLALGAWWAGRTQDRSRRHPLRVYGWLEIGIGVYALAVPALFAALSPLYRAVWAAGGSESQVLLGAAKFAGIAVVLIVPTTLMGASLPVLARAVARNDDRVGGEVGGLYATNTFGAVAGTFLAGFVAIPAMGVQWTLFAAAAGNLLLGGAAVWIARSTRSPAAVAPATASAGDARGTAARAHGATSATLLLVLFAVSGFGAMVLEVAWTRALALVLGSSVYAFSLMLLAFLTGLAAGGAAFSAWLRRHPGVHPGTLLAVLFAGTGLAAYGTVFLFGALPRLFAEVYFSTQLSPDGWFGVQFLFGLVVMFPATFLFGGIFPAALQLYARGVDGIASSVGTVYSANTAGTIVGAATAGFLLVPNLGVQPAVILIASLQLVIAAVATVRMSRLRARKGVAGGLVVLAGGLWFAHPGWDPVVMNSGVYVNLQDVGPDGSWEEFLAVLRNDIEVVYAEEGLTASVMVADQPEIGNRYLAVNGKIEASTYGDMETQLMCAHLPLLLHEDPKDVLVIGLASGITAGSAATYPIEQLRIVEVEAAMEPAARLFAEQNGHVLDDERVRLSINDARNELEFAERDYDVIISEPSNPWMTVASNLFTEDFFRLAAERVRPGGIFAQWVQNYCLPTEDLRSILAAFREAFPHVMMFQTFGGVDFVLLGSHEPFELDLERMVARMSELRVRMDLARIDVRSPYDILPLFLLGPNAVDRWVEGAPRNTDDNARVEFSAPRSLFEYTLETNLAAVARFQDSPLEYASPEASNPEERDRRRLELAEAFSRRERDDAARPLAEAALDGPLDERARAFLESLDMLP